MFTTLFVGLFLIVKYAASDGQCGATVGGWCPTEWGRWKNHYYKVTERMTWLEAKWECGRIGGVMIVPQSPEEITHFSTLLYEYWIGCNDLQREGTWVCLESEEYAGRWHSKEPGGGRAENCMEIYAGSLNDKPCDAPVRAICKQTTFPQLHL